MAENAIKFTAEVYKLQTLTDHGIRVTLNLSEGDIPQMAMLAEVQRQGLPLEFTCTTYLDSGDMEIGRTGKTRTTQKG